MNHKEPERRKTVDAEIKTFVLLAAGYFTGNIEKSLCFCPLYRTYTQYAR
jgi:hypothetical protein